MLKLKSLTNRVITIAAIAGTSSSYAQTPPITKAAAILSEQFETVASTDSRFLLNIKIDMQSADSFYGLRLPFVEFIAGLTTMSPSAENDIEKAYSVIQVGAKDFKSPQGLGLVESSKCYIAVQGTSTQPDLSVDLRQAVTTSIDNRKVWTWSLPSDENGSSPTPFFAAQVGPHYFVLSNNLDEFRQTMRALASSKERTAHAPGILDWVNIRGHSYWAYRSLRRLQGADPESAGLSHVGSDVKAISFSADLVTRESTLRVFTSDPEMKEAPAVLPPSEMQTLQPREKGIWEASIPLTMDKAGYESMFWLFAALGSGVYV